MSSRSSWFWRENHSRLASITLRESPTPQPRTHVWSINKVFERAISFSRG